ncbi:MAG: hypothetical protein HYR64_09080 [Fimbriimonas ginsengisoli]|uniref:Uncharacterized protein n=1 Tax=Fimbriimonas ginsengisoli TaxID=1005039 RepID=A0A931PUB2_FIMGI|nr:hypothetical protein [Fimbriimonas ginsengisoli]
MRKQEPEDRPIRLKRKEITLPDGRKLYVYEESDDDPTDKPTPDTNDKREPSNG